MQENQTCVMYIGFVPYRFIVLEHLGGGTLSRKLNYTYADHPTYGMYKLEQSTAFEYALKLADALRYIHDDFHPQVRLFHRDLKSDNIAFLPSGEMKLFDFGLCEMIRKAKIEDTVFSLGHGVGSWRYTAPEVRSRDYYNHKSDVYGWAILFYHMLTGKHPIDNEWDKVKTYQKVVEEGWRPSLNMKWPTKLNRLLARSWNYDIKVRPTFAEIVEQLKEIRDMYPDIEKGQKGGVLVNGIQYVV